MQEVKTMSALEVRRVANGWIVQPSKDLYMDRCVMLTDVHVFGDWAECSDFMRQVTMPTRSE
jgi:hypothetical protein